MISMPERVTLVEVSPRDGLQGQSHILSVDQRVALISMLAGSGLTRIEAGSFVSPERIPPMRNTAEVIGRLPDKEGVRYSALTPNQRGLDQALAAGVKEIAIFTGASETFTRKNIGCSIDESLARFQPIAEQALARGILIRGYLSCTMGCPYEGDIALDTVVGLTRDLYQLGCYEVSLGDTIGVGNPQRVQTLIAKLLQILPQEAIAVHFHDTYGQALANIYGALQCGVTVVDSSVAGLGGCPYARGASGNVATEDVLYMLNGLGIETGVDMETLLVANKLLCQNYGFPNHSRAALALQSRLKK